MDRRKEIASLLENSMGMSEWKKKYRPIKNQLSTNTNQEVFETNGVELEFILKQDPKHVWTCTYGDFADFIVAGNQWSTNNLGFYFSEVPWEKESDYALVSVEVECECYFEDGYEAGEVGNPDCPECEGYGYLKKYLD